MEEYMAVYNPVNLTGRSFFRIQYMVRPDFVSGIRARKLNSSFSRLDCFKMISQCPIHIYFLIL